MAHVSSQKSQAELEKETLGLIHNFLMDLGNERATRALDSDAYLDKDLGLGSIERVELLIRIEKNFAIRLPERFMYEVDRVSELIAAVQKASTQSPVPVQNITATLPITEEAAIIPIHAQTLVEVLASYARLDPNRPHLYLQADHTHNDDEQIIRYGQLFETASVAAQGLLERGLQAGETVALMLPTGKEFFYAFFAVLLAGGIPVPIYPPVRPSQIGEYVQRQAIILSNAQVRILITHQQTAMIAGLLRPLIPDLNEVVTLTDLMRERGIRQTVTLSGTSAALIQYTSGSTDNPKGVLLTHQNLLSNIRAIGKALAIKPKDVIVSWLPLYHDMGLIGAWLCSLYFGIPAVIMSPFSFLTQPERWLWAIHYHRGTISAAPNFAYELCLRKIAAEKIEGLDLSSWRLALNGAETVNPATIEQFSKRFAAYGFSPLSMLPVYGLAEAAVALAFPPINRSPHIDRVDRATFESLHRAQAASADDSNALKFVSCGKPLPGMKIRLVDPAGKEITAERVVGHLEFQGASVTSGYFHALQKTEEIFHEGWCDSGDFAYMAEGEIFITGRKKDIIIKTGSNYYPEELESIVSEVEGVRKGCVVAFGIYDVETGTEKMILVAEIKPSSAADKEKITQEIITQLAVRLGVPPDDVCLVPPHTIPKTSSGKLRRSACRQLYQSHLLEPSKRSTVVQIAKLWSAGIWPKTKSAFKKLVTRLYTTYAAIILVTTILPLWAINYFNRQRTHLNRKLSHYWACIFTSMIGCPVSVQGLEYLQSGKPLILAPNHASYLDVIALSAAIPYELVFVAKQELAEHWMIGALMAGKKDITIDRTDLAKSELGAEEIKQRLLAGESVLIFPEATFTRAVGIRPFKLGAFKAAIETNTPVCPIAILGTRYILPSKRWTLRRRRIEIIITEPIIPKAQNFAEMKRLRDETRSRLIALTKEPRLDLAAAGPE